MSYRGGRVAAGVVCVLALLAAPAQAAPTGSQDVTPLIHTLVDGAPYVVQPLLQPTRDALRDLRPPRKLLLRGTVVTMDDGHSVLPQGSVLVVGDKIAALWAGPAPAGLDIVGATVVDSGPNGLIFPGLINLHDHPSYDALPVWPTPTAHKQPAIGRPLGTEPYANRYQWGSGGTGPVELERRVDNAQDVLTASDALGRYVDVLKHAEARAALGGQTAIQGESSEGEPALDGLLVRNVGATNFGRDRVDQRVPNVEDPAFAAVAADVHARMAAGQLDAWLVHLAEGVRDGDRRAGDTVSSRHELDRIADLGVLTDATVVLHGVGLEQADFAKMRAATGTPGDDGLGAKLVWAPMSNLLLYGRTTQIYRAIAEGVTVSLGTDWTPSGSNTLLGELKVADIALRDTRLLGGDRATVPGLLDDVALDRLLVDMVTRNPARTLRWPEAGTIAPGTAADLVIIQRPVMSPTNGMPASPYRSLIDATERDVGLVMVGGDPIAGDPAVMRALRGRDLELVKSADASYTKAIDVTKRGVPHGNQRLSRVERRLADGLAALGGDFSYLRKHFDGGRYLLSSNAEFRDQVLAPRYGTVGGQVNLERMRLHPLLAGDDFFFFDVIGGIAGPTPYPANLNYVTPAGNPFAPMQFFARWY